MHDDDTRSSERNWMPWENTAVVDDPTTDDATTTSTTAAAAPRRFALTWQQGVALAGAGLIAFLGMSQFLGAPSRVSVHASSTPKQASQAHDVSASMGAAAPGEFPQNSVMTCSTGDHDVPNPKAQTVRTVAGSATSCAFARDSEAAILDHLSSSHDNPVNRDRFSLDVVSKVTGQRYRLICTRSAHLTYCTGGNGAAIYVKDTIAS